MHIRDMFVEDINRPINGVIKVDQDAIDVIDQEVREYVVTKELKKHFISFFNYYGDAFDKPTADIGVWISGFFGSGKSHFLKMLSYILENRDVGDVKTIELFRKKFEDDPATFMLIDNATKHNTETILFNIDIEGPINKDKTAVLRVFAKMFYSHLGYYGDNLKVAMLEQYVDRSGKTDEFRRVFEQKKGKTWLDQRRAFAFNGKFIIPTLMEVMGMGEEDANNWFNDKSGVDFSIAQLVEDINEYVNKQPKNFRLLFMIDEVGQYVGTDTDLLLNLQSIVEKLGSECSGKVWVVCTGQEAIDEIIKVRANEFSRIQARFKTRLSLTSSSVDEVVQKRILEKKPEAAKKLEAIYNENDSVLRNLFSFTNAVSDIRGYSNSHEFVVNYPFVPYQFILMQRVFNEIRKHGNAGVHQATGERSMLSGFQEAAQKVQNSDEYTLVPFFRFYDTLHASLDGSIRRVIERCRSAAENSLGIEMQDVDLLKLLYLLRYIDSDIRATLDNLLILMADDIRTDKIILRESVRSSLDRLLNQNYIGYTGETYNFLTDEEQDIEKEIKNENVDTNKIIERIANIIYGDIFTTKKFRYEKYDFPFDQMVDDVTVGAATGGMKLKFLTNATDDTDKSEMRLMAESAGQAIVVLPGSDYYTLLEKALKIRNIKPRNLNQLAKSVQNIINNKLAEATSYDNIATKELRKAIESAEYYVDGERLSLKSGDAISKINQALEYLVTHVYSELSLITKNIETDAEIANILTGSDQYIPGLEPNRDAAAKMEEYLEMQYNKKLPTSMSDVQTRYQGIPYGWREIDIAAVAARLIYEQKVTIKYAGTTIQPTDPKLPDMLRKKSEIGKTIISKRQVVSVFKMKQVREFLRDYFDIMDVPDDEDGLIAFIVKRFSDLKEHYESLEKHYKNSKYPDHELVLKAIELMSDVLSHQKDNIALIDSIIAREDALDDNKEAMQKVEEFFRSQVFVFDKAVKMLDDLANELDYLAQEEEADKALNRIRLLIQVNQKFDYRCIPELNTLMATVREGHDRLLEKKREEVLEIVRQCMSAIHTAASMSDAAQMKIVTATDNFYAQRKERIAALTSLALLDGLVPPMLTEKDEACAKLELLNRPPEPKPAASTSVPPKKKIIKFYNRQVVFPAKRLESEEEIDSYVENMRDTLKKLIKNSDGIELK